MKKIPTIFKKNPNDLGRVIESPLMEGIHHFKIKIDGTACAIIEGKPFKRFGAKLFKRKRGKIITKTLEQVRKELPDEAIPCQEPDKLSGHFPHWIPILENDPSSKYLLEGFNLLEEKLDGTYECIGERIQRNPHKIEGHKWIPHFSDKLIIEVPDTSFEGFRKFLEEFPYEGLVAYDKNNQPIGKIRRSDYGFVNKGYKSV